ncbi:hypothetical protein GUITHDRAFT_154089 [Guillardia theta CCMP2712]|uniref:Autophagy-related protein 11 C-terminal domain-containing protein n=1 Tax=Guillardia theta (strain CCMP2712) TaxID=905079 RepID=L1IW91_GUITC|nr:hypothetical protein GUITHDRAFT_154089 [Guillardia theta CCMP2712]EKX40533.1 hypothetical protein GUITHDRAFT_154089 [Guillardia theta CCMP2712]|eukprot:XP_005827513.1 hypothetical protein GUITHDRAFT_154089 [Guillardia theta CCMP2712]
MCSKSKISFTSFEAGDTALFLPTSSGNFIAFHRSCPFRYLSQESLEAAKTKAGGLVDYVLGSIVEIYQHFAGEGEDGNPYSLPAGTPYYICTVIVL